MRQSRLQLLDAGVQIFDSLPVDESELIHVVKVKAAVGEDALSHVVELMAVVEVLDGLFEAYGDEEAEDDGGDVDEEVAPGAGGVVGGVDVEHGGWVLRFWRGDGVGRGDGLLRRHGGGFGHSWALATSLSAEARDA
jgi:hypothetical protein